MHKGTITSLQFLRAVAAYLVVSMHTSEAIAVKITATPDQYWKFGSFGVDLFFVISGFIMEFLIKDSGTSFSERLHQATVFLKKRFIRIVPLYWFYTILKIVVLVGFPFLALRTTFDNWHILSSFLFIPLLAPWGLTQPFLPVGWTLNFEMFFYFVFATAIFMRQDRFIFCCLIFFLIKAADLISDSVVIDFYSQSIIFEFAAGVLIAKFFKGNFFKPPTYFYLATLILAITYLITTVYIFRIDDRFLRYGISASLIVFSMLGLEPLLQKQSFFRRLAVLGDYSYTTYLLHTFIVPAAPLVLLKMQISNIYVAFATALTITAVSSYFAYHYLEVKLINIFRGKNT